MAGKTLNGIERLLINKRDEFLIKETLNGNEKAFQTLIKLYKKRVVALGMSFFSNPDDTDDFVPEVFVKVYMNLSKFNYRSSFATWITKIAYNSAVNSVTRRQEYVPLANEDMLQSKALGPEEEEIRKTTLDTIRECVLSLPENYGRCVEMYFFHGLKYEEISEITGFPVNTIKSYIFRSKKLMADNLRGVIYEQ